MPSNNESSLNTHDEGKGKNKKKHSGGTRQLRLEELLPQQVDRSAQTYQAQIRVSEADTCVRDASSFGMHQAAFEHASATDSMRITNPVIEEKYIGDKEYVLVCRHTENFPSDETYFDEDLTEHHLK